MKQRTLFAALMLLQITIILLLIWQLQLGEDTGKEMTLKTKEEEEYYQTFPLTGTYYADFDINYIRDDQLNGDPATNDRIYVLLTKDADTYQVKEAYTKKMTAKEDEIILVGTYRNEYKRAKEHYVQYGFEQIKQIDVYGEFTNREPLLVSFDFSNRWNQYTLKTIQRAE